MAKKAKSMEELGVAGILIDHWKVNMRNVVVQSWQACLETTMQFYAAVRADVIQRASQCTIGAIRFERTTSWPPATRQGHTNETNELRLSSQQLFHMPGTRSPSSCKDFHYGPRLAWKMGVRQGCWSGLPTFLTYKYTKFPDFAEPFAHILNVKGNMPKYDRGRFGNVSPQ